MRRRALLFVLLGLVVAGCWSRIEVSELGVVVGMAVDRGEEEAVRLTFFVSRSPGTGQMERGQAQWVVAREGRNVPDALSRIRQASPRRIVLHHLRVVLIGEEFARAGLDELFDFLSRDPQIRLHTRVMVVEGRAQHAFEIEPNLEALQPENIAEFISAKGGPNPRLKELMVGRAAESFSPWVYTLHVIERPARMPQTSKLAVELSGAALMRGDRVVAMLDQELTQALMWLERNPREATLVAPCPTDGPQSVSGHVQKGNVSVIPSVLQGKLSILISVTGSVDLIHSECSEDVVDPAGRRRLEAQMSATLAGRITRLVKVVQEVEADPTAIGKWVQLKQTAYWRTIPQDQWPKVWKTVPVTVEASILINRAGLLVNPANRTRFELEKQQRR